MTKRRGEPSSLQLDLQKKKKKKLDLCLCFKSVSPPCSVCNLSTIEFENEPEAGGPISIPGVLGASGYSTVTIMTVFQVATKGFVVAMMGWVREVGVVADCEGKVPVREEKNKEFLNFI